MKKDISRWSCLLLCFSSELIELIEPEKPIDIGHNRSIRGRVESLLDRWLKIDANLEKWKSKMATSKKRIPIVFVESPSDDEQCDCSLSERL